uniref:ZP domain-containing protein n=1 Tax=Knipowitschia caucasica TaxID=637954 RepID=A0AAV2JBA8_KNICA
MSNTTTSSSHHPIIITANLSASEAITVNCNMASITVTVARDFLQSSQITDTALYLGMVDCRVNGGNSTHAQLTVDWDECNTLLMHNDSFYTASVTLFNTINTREVPKIRLQIPVMCTYMKNVLITSGSSSMGYDMIKDVITGSGMFQLSVQLMNGTVPLPHNYSLSPSEALVLVVSLNTTVERIKVVINKCWATSTPSPALVSSYIFMQNRLSVQILSFVDLSIIYLHCQVEICVEIELGSCVPLNVLLPSEARTSAPPPQRRPGNPWQRLMDEEGWRGQPHQRNQNEQKMRLI